MPTVPAFHRVRVEPSGAVLEVRHEEPLMKAAQRLGYRWPTLCDGEGSCTICAVEVVDNPEGLTPLGPAESAALRFCQVSGRGDGPVRLACQARVTGDVVVHKKGVRQLHPPNELSERKTMSNTEIVRKFLAGMETPITQVRGHLREFLTDDAEWGNCGFPPAIGIEDITAKHELSEKVFGDYKLHVQLRHIAEGADGVVFTERVDVGRTQEGEEILTVPVTGVFELRDGKISRWTDYFDPTGLLSHLNALPEIGEYFTGKSAASA